MGPSADLQPQLTRAMREDWEVAEAM